MTHGSLFSGFGAADLAAEWMGWRNAFWCEIDPFPRRVLRYWFPNQIGYEDITKTDFTRWRGRIDVLTGGFPCQPFSVAGRRKGADDDRYLWPEMLRAIREIRPSWVVGENVAGILTMVQPGREVEVEHQASMFEAGGKETVSVREYVVETVCRDLEREGYSVQPALIPACAVGAPHRRDRVFFIAHRADARAKTMQCTRQDGVHDFRATSYPDVHRCGRRCKESTREQDKEWIQSSNQGLGKGRVASDANRAGREKQHAAAEPEGQGHPAGMCNEELPAYRWADFPTQPPVCRGNDGLPFDVERLTLPFAKWRAGVVKGYGNAIVPQVMYEIFNAIGYAENEQLT